MLCQPVREFLIFLFREIRKKISKSSIKGVKLESVEVTIANSIKSTFQQ
jgi:hypothetical protein